MAGPFRSRRREALERRVRCRNGPSRRTSGSRCDVWTAWQPDGLDLELAGVGAVGLAHLDSFPGSCAPKGLGVHRTGASPAFSDLATVRVFKAEPGDAEKQLRVPAWLWNSGEWAAFSDAARGVQQPLLNQALRLLRAGADISQNADRRLATLRAGYTSVLGGLIATGPGAYSTFPGLKNVGTILQAAHEAAQTYQGALSGDAQVRLDELITALNGVIDGHLDQGKYWTAFDEPSLSAVMTALRRLWEALPTIDVSSVVSEDAPISFDVSEVVSHLEVLGAGEGGGAAQFAATVGLRIRTMLAHVRLRSVVGPGETEESLEAWLTDYLGAAEDLPSVSVIDLSLVPSSLMHVVTAVIERVVFEALQRYRRRNRVELPTVLVVEEAHHFVSRYAERASAASEAAVVCKETIETIAREGRKFGLGMVLSSQRPSEVSPTLLSQCNTFLLHRIVNDRDQKLVRRLVPDNLGRMLDDLPTLPTRHAVLLGWATASPLLVQVRELEPERRPQSSDPHFWDTWTGSEARPVDWAELAERWRLGAY